MKKSLIIFILFFISLYPAGDLLSAIDKPDQSGGDFESQRFQAGARYVSGELLIKFNNQVSEQEINHLQQKFQVKVKNKIQVKNNKLNWQAVSFNQSVNLEELAQEYKKLPQVEYAEPNYIAQAFMLPNDPYYSPYQVNLKNINLEPAWDLADGTGAVVAIADSGIAYDNYGSRIRKLPEFENTNFVPGYDFVENDNLPFDDNGHGTHLAGTVASGTNNNQGVAGLAYAASLMPIKILDRFGYGTYEEVAQGIIWAVEHGAKVINLSLGAPQQAQILKDAVDYAVANNVLIVSAVGNSGTNQVNYPAAYDGVLGVGAVDFANQKTYYSNFGEFVDLVAPGGNLRQDLNRDGWGDGILQQTLRSRFLGSADQRNFGYYFYEGTSSAAAHVSGLAALLISQGVNSLDELVRILTTSSQDLGQPGKDADYGWGLVDAYQALLEVNQGDESDESDEGNEGDEVNLPPLAQLIGDEQAWLGQSLNFSAAGSYDPDGQIVEYNWDFGDGVISQGRQVEHSYSQPGQYLVKLTVIDNQGAEGLAEMAVVIQVVPIGLSAEINFTNRQGNVSESFEGRERVYLMGKVFDDQEPVRTAWVRVEVYYPDGRQVKKYLAVSDSQGEFKMYLGRYYQPGPYRVLIKITKTDYDDLVIDKAFSIF